MVAWVPSRSGAFPSLILIVTSAWPLAVISMPLTEPTETPPICTGLPRTSWPALMNSALTEYAPAPPNITIATRAIAAITAPSAAILPTPLTVRILPLLLPP